MAKVKFDKEAVKFTKTKNRRRTKAKHLRGQKKLGPKSADRGNKGKY
jgi:hypothetical protein